MDLTLGEHEEAIRAAAARFLDEALPLGVAAARRGDAWAQIVELGLPAAASPEAVGGSDLGHGVEALVFAELGRHLAPLVAIGAAVAGGLAARAGETDLAKAILGGERVALAVGRRALDAADARWVLAGGGLRRLPAGLDVRPSIDPLAAQVHLGAIAGPARLRWDARGFSHLRLLVAAYALGLAEAARDLAAEHARTREQFGRPIGAFQGIKHPCADMAVRAAAARAQLVFAALSLEADADDAAFQLAAARRLAGAAALANARAAIQVFGGMGMTDECPAHLVLKRAHLLAFVAPDNRRILLGEAA